MIDSIIIFFAVIGFFALVDSWKKGKKRQDLINRLDQEDYLHTDYGAEQLRDFDLGIKPVSRPPPPPQAAQWPRQPLPPGFKPWPGFTRRELYAQGIMMDPPRDFTPAEIQMWWDSIPPQGPIH